MSKKEAPTLNENVSPVPEGRDRILPPLSYILVWTSTAVFLGYFLIGANLVPPYGQLNLFQAVWAIIVGKLIVMIMFSLNGAPGWKYGIPMVLQIQASFGTSGYVIPSLIRAVPAIFWFGVQTWVGALALNTIATTLFGFNHPLLFFVVFQLVQTWIGSSGFSSIKWFDLVCSIFIIISMIYIMAKLVGTYGAELHAITTIEGTWGLPFWAGVTAMLGAYSTLMINISDYVRYMPKKTSKAMYTISQLVGILPGAMFMCMIGIIGIVTTGQYDPVAVFASQVDNKLFLVVLMVFIAIAQFTTNLVGNIVPPTMVICNIFKVKWRTAALISGVLGLFTFPWVIMTSNGFNLFVQIYSMFLGPILGVMVADYFVLRKRDLNLKELLNKNGAYRFAKGYNPFAFVAIVVGAVCSLAFLQISWFVSFGVGFVVYWILMKAWGLKKYPIIPGGDADQQIADVLREQAELEAAAQK